MKFIHAADAHLDSPFLGLSFLPKSQQIKIYQSTYDAFKVMIKTAITEQVDFVLLAGDIFDSNTPTISAQLFLREQMEKLNQANIPVFFIYGNHDYFQQENYIGNLPKNVSVYTDQIESKELITESGEHVNIVSFSYYQNHINDDMIKDFPAKTNNYTIGMLHGAIAASTGNDYAPFNLDEIKALNYDYFALGHIHLRQDLSEQPLISYSGNIQGRHINEQGEKGFYLVEVENNQTSRKFINTSQIEFDHLDLNFDELTEINELQKQVIDSANEKITDTTKFFVVNLRFSKMSQLVKETLENNDFLIALGQSLKQDSLIVKFNLIDQHPNKLNNFDEEFYQNAKEIVLTNQNIQKLTNKLQMKYPFIAASLSDETIVKEIFDQAELTINDPKDK